MTTDLVVARGQQLVGLLLSTMPMAERMWLYNLALAAWILLPRRGRGWLAASRIANPAQS